jgi:hypothetical protein
VSSIPLYQRRIKIQYEKKAIATLTHTRTMNFVMAALPPIYSFAHLATPQFHV